MSVRPSVAVVLSGEQTASVHAQTHVSEESFVGPGALGRAARSESDWVWLLAPGALPEPDALRALVEAARDHLPRAPALVAGTVRGRDGVSIVRHLPAGDQRSTELVDAVESRALPIRNATFANCLVARACFDEHGLPDGRRYGPFAPVQWSAQVLRASAGYFVPASVVTLDVNRVPHHALSAFVPLLRMLRTGAWTRGETLANIGWWLQDTLAFATGGAG